MSAELLASATEAAGGDSQGVQTDIAEGIYDIRAALAQIHMWRTHYGKI